MPETTLTVHPVEVSGSWGGMTVRATAALSVDSAAVWLAKDLGSDPRFVASFETLTDAHFDDAGLAIYRQGDVLQFQGPEPLPRVWSHIIDAAAPLPEVARGLRAFGTKRGGSMAAQQRFFGPLLLARRALEQAVAPIERVAAFNAPDLLKHADQLPSRLASERFPSGTPDFRALEAELEEDVEPLAEVLRRLARSSEVLQAAPAGARFRLWSTWTGDLRSTFLVADRVWGQVVATLRANG